MIAFMVRPAVGWDRRDDGLWGDVGCGKDEAWLAFRKRSLGAMRRGRTPTSAFHSIARRRPFWLADRRGSLFPHLDFPSGGGVLMIRSLFVVAVVWGCVTLSAGRAAVISRDWKTPGDGLLTYDDVNQREWLDLSQTLLTSQFPGATQEDRYQYVASQTAPGGLFAGFSVAKSVDVIALAQSAGINSQLKITQRISRRPSLWAVCCRLRANRRMETSSPWE
jgi:hypothetical protein